MVWMIVLAAVCGGLAGTLAPLLARRAKRKQPFQSLLFVGLFLALFTSGRAFLLPEVRALQMRSEASTLFGRSRLFSVLATRHPEIRDQYTDFMVDLARRDASREELDARSIAWGRELAKSYFPQYAPRASGEALAAFVGVTVDILAQLDARPDDTCYTWMAGGSPSSGSQEFVSAVSARDWDRANDALADVIASAVSSPGETPDARQSAAAMDALLGRLVAEHGESFMRSLSLLEQPVSSEEDRRTACHAALALYRGALEFPADQREVLLRSMFAAARS